MHRICICCVFLKNPIFHLLRIQFYYISQQNTARTLRHKSQAVVMDQLQCGNCFFLFEDCLRNSLKTRIINTPVCQSARHNDTRLTRNHDMTSHADKKTLLEKNNSQFGSVKQNINNFSKITTHVQSKLHLNKGGQNK